MARHGKQYSSARTRRTSRKVSDATIGTHVRRSAPDQAKSRQQSSLSYSDKRVAARASESHVDTFMPSATSGEDLSTYRRRSSRRRYVESVQRKAWVRRIVTALIAILIVAGLALGAGWLAFRGVLGSAMALRDSDARDALSAPAADEPVYTLVTAELGAVAQPLEQEGPDMMLLLMEDRQSGVLSIISIPPSLKVAVDNDTMRLADMAANGDAALISAVESYTKLDVHHLVKIPEGGVSGIVDSLGDVEVTFDQVVDDPNAGDVYYPMGTYTVNGPGALTYLRANNLKMGKSDQMANQAAFFKNLLFRVIDSGKGFTTELDALDDYFQTDLSLQDLESFAGWVREIGDQGVRCDIVPGYFTVSSDVVEDNGELFVSKSAEFAEFIQKLTPGEDGQSEQAEAVQAASPDSFTVEVRNGTDIAGAGKTTAEALDALGFRIADVGNAEQQVYDETLVIYRTKNTPAPEAAPASDGEADGEGEEGEEELQVAQPQQEQSQSSASTPEEQAAAAEAERALGESRAKAVIDALGMGRTVEGDMYYSFTADVLLIIGYDYKPVS